MAFAPSRARSSFLKLASARSMTSFEFFDNSVSCSGAAPEIYLGCGASSNTTVPGKRGIHWPAQYIGTGTRVKKPFVAKPGAEPGLLMAARERYPGQMLLFGSQAILAMSARAPRESFHARIPDFDGALHLRAVDGHPAVGKDAGFLLR